MVEFSPIPSSGEVQSTSSVGGTKGTKPASGTKNVPMVDEKNQKPEQQVKAKKALEKEIKSGNAVYNETSFFGVIGTLVERGRIDNEVLITVPSGTKLGDIRKKYNLPPGSLRHMVTSGGGNFDSYEVSGIVNIYADDMEKGLGVSGKELKKMFPDKQFSSWYFK